MPGSAGGAPRRASLRALRLRGRPRSRARARAGTYHGRASKTVRRRLALPDLRAEHAAQLRPRSAGMARRRPAFAFDDDARAAHGPAWSWTGHGAHFDARSASFYEIPGRHALSLAERVRAEHGRVRARAQAG